jgi:hypothetical protein
MNRTEKGLSDKVGNVLCVAEHEALLKAISSLDMNDERQVAAVKAIWKVVRSAPRVELRDDAHHDG